MTGSSPQAFLLLTVLLWIMHRANIARLLRGDESKIGAASTSRRAIHEAAHVVARMRRRTLHLLSPQEGLRDGSGIGSFAPLASTVSRELSMAPRYLRPVSTAAPVSRAWRRCKRRGTGRPPDRRAAARLAPPDPQRRMSGRAPSAPSSIISAARAPRSRRCRRWRGAAAAAARCKSARAPTRSARSPQRKSLASRSWPWASPAIRRGCR